MKVRFPDPPLLVSQSEFFNPPLASLANTFFMALMWRTISISVFFWGKGIIISMFSVLAIKRFSCCVVQKNTNAWNNPSSDESFDSPTAESSFLTSLSLIPCFILRTKRCVCVLPRQLCNNKGRYQMQRLAEKIWKSFDKDFFRSVPYIVCFIPNIFYSSFSQLIWWDMCVRFIHFSRDLTFYYVCALKLEGEKVFSVLLTDSALDGRCSVEAWRRMFPNFYKT